MGGEIKTDDMYICEFKDTGKWEVRKVNKRTIKTQASYVITTEYNEETEEGIASCDCKAFENRGHCKHIEMVGGKLSPQESQTRLKGESQIEEVRKFLVNYAKEQFEGEEFVQYCPENDGIAERYDIVSESDERKLMWTSVTVPIGGGADTATIVVRVVFSTNFKEDVDALSGDKDKDSE